MKPRVAIIGSCVTRDVWNQAGFPDDARPDLLYLARTSFASLFAEPEAGFEPPQTPGPGLSAWELRMVADDVLKRSVGKLLEYRPTHIVVDLIDERFDLLRRGPVVVAYSWELHLAGLADGPLKRLEQVSRHSAEAAKLWRAGVDAFAAFLKRELPDTRIIFHDARWALEYLDEAGVRRPFDPDRVLWAGLPANIHDHNAILADYAAYLRRALPAAFLVRAPRELLVGDEGHRWGLSPFHYTDAYYRYVWVRLQELGCGRPGSQA